MVTAVTVPTAESVVKPQAVQALDLLTKYHYEIPDYQREFTWKQAHCDSLWSDISDLAAANLSKKKDLETHFLGPIVVQVPGSGRVQIIDGQQRLTYLTILLTCLLDVAHRHDMRHGTAWEDNLKNGIQIHPQGVKKLRVLPQFGIVRSELEELVLNCSDRPSREAHLLQMPVTDQRPRGRLARAFRSSYTNIDDYVSAHSATSAKLEDGMQTLFTCVTACLPVVSLEVMDASKSFDVFERLNARGVPLGQADLVKNLVLKYAEEQKTRTDADSAWQKFITEVDGAGASIGTGSSWLSAADFLQIIYMSTWGDLKGSDLLSPYRRLLREEKVPAKDLMDYLVRQARLLRNLVAAPSAWGDRNRALTTLLRTHLRNKFSLSFALALSEVHKGSKKEFLWGLVLLHSYVFRFFILGKKQLSAYALAIGGYARGLRCSSSKTAPGPPPKEPQMDLGSVSKKMSAEASQTNLQQDLVKYRPGSEKLGYYMAYMLEVGAARKLATQAFPGQHPDLQSPSTHLEHIMPKNVSNSAAWKHLGLSAEDAKPFVSMWGNLLVLPAGVNSSIKDKSIKDKVVEYRGAKCAALQLPKQVSPNSRGEWNIRQIHKREVHLASTYAEHAWPFPNKLADVK
jgi:hypothetical protein